MADRSTQFARKAFASSRCAEREREGESICCQFHFFCRKIDCIFFYISLLRPSTRKQNSKLCTVVLFTTDSSVDRMCRAVLSFPHHPLDSVEFKRLKVPWVVQASLTSSCCCCCLLLLFSYVLEKKTKKKRRQLRSGSTHRLLRLCLHHLVGRKKKNRSTLARKQKKTDRKQRERQREIYSTH